MDIENFGRNIRFRPTETLIPRCADELLENLRSKPVSKVRVIASRHSWSPLIETSETLIDLKLLNAIEVFDVDGEPFVRVGAGCQIKELIRILNQSNLTLPSLGLITEQRIAGAISTATHGSGKNSLSHYIRSARVICFPDSSETAELVEINDGPELEALRCSLGAMGVIVELVFPCIPQYYLKKRTTKNKTLQEIVDREKEVPLQQAYLLPYSWNYVTHERIDSEVNRPCKFAWLYRIYWYCFMDVGLHLLILFFAQVMHSRFLIQRLFGVWIPRWLPSCIAITDRSDRILTMEHELFRHIEMEIFVREETVLEAEAFLIDLLKFAADENASLSEGHCQQLADLGLTSSLQEIHGEYVHHYPICLRKVLRDDTMISMSAGESESWYAVSLISYTTPRDDYFRVMTLLSKSMASLFEARIHWGKWFPQEANEVAQLYPRLQEFREICQRFDSRKAFQNKFVKSILFDASNEQPDSFVLEETIA